MQGARHTDGEQPLDGRRAAHDTTVVPSRTPTATIDYLRPSTAAAASANPSRTTFESAG
jgi:hypothetical protein